ncbi:methylmalonyl-CoA epimerase [Anseongella ginsenosidimutans]|uniref:Methylmalonyl-CoA epimerase n=1 Tax=Anseongella ginsenosidimutans TaxID=496056 RepID=A0A4V6NZ18_9SPHI|nr:methylmalonyl-CoA epimerase [Anseongella ginsenosidimutans]QEC52701.1 methylmalonyl-CoA epimerase [Anseongella ginsenosidimutans]TCS85449.1 methylmalonyl-CoA epimerase [Anseongella ginsenosidimutans]
MNRIDHIGIAVKDLKSASEIYTRLLGKPFYKTERVAAEDVETAFFACGENKVELLESTSENSAISRFIEKRGEGIHHLAFEVDDIRAEIARLKGEGFDFIAEEPQPGADNKLICFLHPRKTAGVLIELCQEMSHL